MDYSVHENHLATRSSINRWFEPALANRQSFCTLDLFPGRRFPHQVVSPQINVFIGFTLRVHKQPLGVQHKDP